MTRGWRSLGRNLIQEAFLDVDKEIGLHASPLKRTCWRKLMAEGHHLWV